MVAVIIFSLLDGLQKIICMVKLWIFLTKFSVNYVTVFIYSDYSTELNVLLLNHNSYIAGHFSNTTLDSKSSSMLSIAFIVFVVVALEFN